MNKYFVSLLLLMVCSSIWAQKKKDILLTIDGAPVYASEFKRVYSKNLELVQDDSQKSVDGYLDLFIDYKLKVKEAYDQQLNETAEYQREFTKYEDQLSRGYLYEDNVSEELVREAYDRGLEEVEASHILVRSTYLDLPQDTLKAYNKIKEAQIKARNGADFAALVKEYSDEPGAAARGGALGYFSAFKMVYDFESEAFNTEVGAISDIVRTQFGYHIIKVTDRRKREPQISVAHIMIIDKKDNPTFDPEERINDLYAKIQQGESFESLAKQYSDDKGSAKKNGDLKPFIKGDLRSAEFENAAYTLQNPGDISKPVKSEFGWHIIKLNERFPIASFEEEKERLLRRVENSERSKLIDQAVSTKIKNKHSFKKEVDFIPYFLEYVSDSVLKKQWKYTPIPTSENKKIFTIGDTSYRFDDYAKFLETHQKNILLVSSKQKFLSDVYEVFEEETIRRYFRKKLEEDDEKYGATINEYRDGLLIFDAMNENIWGKAKKDTVALKAFYETRKENYTTGIRIEGVIVSTSDRTIAEAAKKLLAQNVSIDEIKEKLNEEQVNVIISEGVFDLDDRALPVGFQPAMGVSEVVQKDTSFIVVNTKNILPAGVKAFEETKGRVISDYQNYLEETWMQELHKKHKVEVNKKTLKKIKKELDS